VPILGSILCNTFIKHLDAGVECTFSKFSDDIRMGGVADTPDGYAALQRNLHRLEKLANNNLIKFIKGKCKSLHLVNNKHMQKYMLTAVWLEAGLKRKT